MKLRLTVAPMMLGLAGCATMGDRPTEQMIAQQLTKERKLVHLTSTMSPEQLRQKAVETDCGKETKDITSIMPVVGTGVVGVSSRYEYTMQSGTSPNGDSWVALRTTNGTLHSSPMGYTMKPTDTGGSQVTVYAADKRQLDSIRAHVESGTLLCHWRDYSYPYD